jgi:putative proteasome-type protease
MTYCIALNLEQGLVFASDSRTNAGVDDVRRAGKMRVFGNDGERLIVTLSAGNLSVTQNAMNLLEHRARHDPSRPGIDNATSMFEVAQHLGEAMREIRKRDDAYLREGNIDPSGSFIVGGQLPGEPQRLFLVYSEGNFIESSPDTPFFQTGEIKFGKPILDRVISAQTSLTEACKCVLVSFDSTMRSNLSVGPPLDLLLYRRDTYSHGLRQRLEEDDPYLQVIRREWNDILRRGVRDLPGPAWLADAGA